jgi:hypothetical protein
MFKLIVNCASTEFIGQCLESVRTQSLSDWEAFVTLDGADNVEDRLRIVKAVAGDRRIRWGWLWRRVHLGVAQTAKESQDPCKGIGQMIHHGFLQNGFLT